ncbi:hypothetical protein D3C75_999660 [compost metagenome]
MLLLRLLLCFREYPFPLPTDLAAALAPKEPIRSFSIGAICWKLETIFCTRVMVPTIPSMPPILSTKPLIWFMLREPNSPPAPPPEPPPPPLAAPAPPPLISCVWGVYGTGMLEMPPI